MSNDIQRFPVPLIYKKILKDCLDGTLHVAASGATRTLYFCDGHLAFASSSLNSEKLTHVLLDQGKITRGQFYMAEDLIQKKELKTREAISRSTRLSSREIFQAIKDTISQIALAVFPLTGGQWRFVMKKIKTPGGLDYKIRLSDMILRGSLHSGNLGYYRKRFSTRSPVIAPADERVERRLEPESRQMMKQLTNYANIPIQDIVRQLGMDEKRFWQILVQLYLLNILDFQEFTLDQNQIEEREEVNELFQQITAGEISHHGVLGVQHGAAPDEIDRAYARFLNNYHPQKLNAAPDSTVAGKAQMVLAQVKESYRALKDGHPGNAPRDTSGEPFRLEDRDTSGLNKGKRARDLYMKANALYKQKQFFKAANLMDEAVQLDRSKANYFLLLGLCHSKLATGKKAAEKHLKKAAEMEPWNADPVFALGQLYLSENLRKKAKIYFERALEINMEHTLAGRAMQDLAPILKGKKSVLSLFGKKK